MRRSLALVLLLCVHLVGCGFVQPAAVAYIPVTEGFAIYYVSDLHLSGEFTAEPQNAEMPRIEPQGIRDGQIELGPFGGGEPGLRRFEDVLDYISADPQAAGLILGGDFTWEHQDGNHTDEQYVLGLCHTRCSVPVYPVTGNHEVLVSSPADSASRYNSWCSAWGHLFRPYRSQADQGATWYARRVRFNGRPTNVVIQAVNNVCAEDAGAHVAYWQNNGTGGWAVDDYPGIKDPTSYQRRAIRATLNDQVGPTTWYINAGHRSIESGALAASGGSEDRFVVSGALAGGGYVNEIDGLLSQRWILLQGDMHEVLHLNGAEHYTISSSVALRNPDAAALAALAARAKAYVYANLVYSEGGAAEALLGSACEACFDSGPTLITTVTRILFTGETTATVQVLIFRNDVPPELVLSWDVTQ